MKALEASGNESVLFVRERKRILDTDTDRAKFSGVSRATISPLRKNNTRSHTSLTSSIL